MKTAKFIGCIIATLYCLLSGKANAQEKIVALTFDDGPNTTTTVKVLDVLKQHNVKASFFLCGKGINKDTRPIINRAVKQGCELGNHSRTHSYMDKLSADKIRMEVEYTSHAIQQITGTAPKFFRPPYIAYNDLMFATINLPFISGFMIEDWLPEVNAEERAKRVLARVKPGDIILLHDTEGNDQTAEALKNIIPEMKKQGYEFVTISELFKRANVTPAAHNNKIYSNVYE